MLCLIYSLYWWSVILRKLLCLGTITTSASSGTALTDTFEISANEGFIDPDGDPISFAFAFESTDGTVITSLFQQDLHWNLSPSL